MDAFDFPDLVTYVVVNNIVYLVVLATVFLMTPLLRLPTSTIYPDILTTASPAYTVAAISIIIKGK